MYIYIILTAIIVGLSEFDIDSILMVARFETVGDSLDTTNLVIFP